MTEKMLEGNVLIAQSGAATAVSNAALAGVLTEALNHESIEEVFACIGGLQGALNESFIDLAAESQQSIRLLRNTPGAILDVGQELKKPQDYDRVLKVFNAHNIRYFFYIGGCEAQATAHQLSEAAKQKHYSLRVIGIPCSYENNLPTTDHSLGYGSAIKYLSSLMQYLTSSLQSGNVAIVDVGTLNQGWLMAGAALTKSKNAKEEAIVIQLPETPFVLEKFLQNIQGLLKQKQKCVIIASDKLIDSNGNYLLADQAVGNCGLFLRQQLDAHLGVKATWMRLGEMVSLAPYCISKQDSDEAFLCGQKAVQSAVQGEDDKMIVLMRGEQDPYSVEVGTTPLQLVVSSPQKAFPSHWIDEDGMPGHAYVKYALPLIHGHCDIQEEQGLPVAPRLQKRFLSKKMDLYANA